MMHQENSTLGPTLLIRHGAGWVAEHRYILDVLIGEHLGLNYESQKADGLNWVEIRCPQAGKQVLLLGANLLLQSSENWLSTRAMPALPLGSWEPGTLIPAWELGEVPVLYPPVSSAPASCGPAQALYLPLDVLGGAFFLLTRYEELVVKRRDLHQRFPASASVAFQAGFILRPLVDEYVELLRLALLQLFPGLPCREHQPRLRLSHDIDHPFQFFGKSLPGCILSAGKRLYHYPQPREAWRGLRAAVHSCVAEHPSADPFATYSSLMEASEALNTPGEFYFMAGSTNRRYEESYDLLQPELQDVLRQIQRRGHIIGLHSSYESFRSESILGSELRSLLRATERAGIQLQSVGGRQHYLRWEAPTTWRCWDKVGLRYDATVGFPEQIGFRCGTAREFPVFDPTRSSQLRLRERPLIAMDVTMTDYMGLSFEESLASLESLWERISRLGGTLEVLIHNCNPLAIRLAKALAGFKRFPAHPRRQPVCIS
jgi:hypothetical protein